MIHIVAALGALLASFLRGSEGAAATIPQVGEGQSAAARHTGGTSKPGNASNWFRESVPLFVFFWGACCRCRWAASPGRSAHQRGTPGPATPATGFGGLFILSCSLAGEASPKLVAGVAARSVCWRCDASVPPAGVFADPTPAAWGTQITYANPLSCGPIFLEYENKSDRLRSSFNGQAGGARSFAGSAGREDPGHGHRP